MSNPESTPQIDAAYRTWVESHKQERCDKCLGYEFGSTDCLRKQRIKAVVNTAIMYIEARGDSYAPWEHVILPKNTYLEGDVNGNTGF